MYFIDYTSMDRLSPRRDTLGFRMGFSILDQWEAYTEVTVSQWIVYLLDVIPSYSECRLFHSTGESDVLE
jgi:hypothetical protein